MSDNVENKLKDMSKNNPDYLWVSGSNLYGTHTASSDMDLRGFVCPPFEYLIGVKKFESIEFDDSDHKIYSLQFFLNLALKGDPLVTEGFFAPDNKILKVSSIGREILSLRNDILSNAVYGRILGYGAAEWRKAMAVKLVSKEAPKEKAQLINDIRNLYHPDKEKMDEFVRMLDDMDEKELVSSKTGLGVKRRKDIEEHGFCRKSAAHAIRLLGQLIELMQTGSITFPRQNADILLGIRNGEYLPDELEDMYQDLVSQAERCRNVSVLPNKPNSAKVWEVYEEMVVQHLHNYCDHFSEW
jgi:predicted nucleotidyltransferase